MQRHAEPPAARSYHSGETGDLAFLIATLRARHPHVPLAAVGYSLGGNGSGIVVDLGTEAGAPV